MAKINQKPQDVSCEGNSLSFALRQMIGQFAFIEIVQVENVNEITRSDGKTYKTLDVKPLLHGVTADNEIIDNETIYGIHYLRLQRGSSGVIMDPEVGDIGLAAVCDRDVSNILNTGKSAAPARPNQLHNASNAIYLTGIASLNGDPKQYVRFLPDGIDIVSPLVVNINAPSVAVTGDVTVDGDVTATGEVKAKGIALSSHVHGGVESGGSTTSGPE
ncbi:hypothetical protein [Pantoea sp.]|uniref:hypothetical protein n=1 Tax=Pantoea sp. TaxID=69393 RepID=UPI0028AE583F|nr:hypothetical protein [Pantoea sp.]